MKNASAVDEWIFTVNLASKVVMLEDKQIKIIN
jgi:hypothetical protein